MFGISESLEREIKESVLIGRQSIKIPTCNFNNDYGILCQWLLVNIGEVLTSNPIDNIDAIGQWYIMYFNQQYCRIWIRTSDDRTLVKLTWA